MAQNTATRLDISKANRWQKIFAARTPQDISKIRQPKSAWRLDSWVRSRSSQSRTTPGMLFKRSDIDMMVSFKATATAILVVSMAVTGCDVIFNRRRPPTGQTTSSVRLVDGHTSSLQFSIKKYDGYSFAITYYHWMDEKRSEDRERLWKITDKDPETGKITGADMLLSLSVTELNSNEIVLQDDFDHPKITASSGNYLKSEFATFRLAPGKYKANLIVLHADPRLRNIRSTFGVSLAWYGK